MVTFLLTDLVGSTALWERAPADMGGAVARSEAIVASAVQARGGVFLKHRGEGDATFCVFSEPAPAVLAAIDIQRQLGVETWPGRLPISMRTIVHTGPAQLRDGDYFGSTVNRAARLRSIAAGGQILVSGYAAAMSQARLGERLTLVDCGLRPLKDVAEPEHVLRVVHPELADEGLPPSPTPSNLPAALTAIIGRAEEIRELEDHLAHHRLVTLLGPGGVGKTRLALEVAATAVTHGRWEGVRYVELAPLRSASHVVGAVARALGLEETNSLDEIRRFLSGRRELLVLDNCEHVVDGAAEVATALIDAGPGTVVLATSRSALRLADEIAFELAPLANQASVRLFLDRAGLVKGADSEDTDIEAISEICRRVDGLPLAIELAAARVAALSPAQILSRLDDRFRVLRGGRGVDARHAGLLAALEWSYDLLDSKARLVLQSLSAFPATFELAAAVDVAAYATDDLDELDVMDAVDDLVDASLCQRVEGRLRLLESVRAFAASKRDECGDGAAVLARHRAWLAAAVTEADAAPDIIDAAERIEDLLADVRSAVATAVVAGDAANGRRIIGALGRWHEIRGDDTEVAALGKAVLNLEAAPVDEPSMRCLAVTTSASLAIGDGEAAELLALLQKCAAEYGQPWLAARSERLGGYAAHRQWRLDDSANHLRAAVGYARASADHAEELQCMLRLSHLVPVEERLEILQRAHELTAIVDDRRSKAVAALLNAERVLLSERDAAEIPAIDAFVLAVETGDSSLAMAAVDILAVRAIERAAWDEIDAWFDEIASKFPTANTRMMCARYFLSVALRLPSGAPLERKRAFLERAQAASEPATVDWLQATSNLAELQLETGDHAGAARSWRHVLETARKMNEPTYTAVALGGAASAAALQGDLEAAHVAVTDALEVLGPSPSDGPIALVLRALWQMWRHGPRADLDVELGIDLAGALGFIAVLSSEAQTELDLVLQRLPDHTDALKAAHADGRRWTTDHALLSARTLADALFDACRGE